MRASGRVWVVTGAAGGIGRALVVELLARGARVAAVDINADGLAATSSLAAGGDRLSTHVVDITDEDAVRALVDAVVGAHGAVDGVINNAGVIQPFENFQDLDDATIRRVLDINLMGPIHMVRAFLPVLLERPEAHVANVSSMGGYFPFPGQTMYGATKAAVKLLTEGLYAELLGSTVSVSVILPGPVETSITQNSGVTTPQAGKSPIPLLSPEEAARITVDGLERDRLHIYLGPVARITSLAIRVAPRRAIALVRKQMDKLMSPSEQAGIDR